MKEKGVSQEKKKEIEEIGRKQSDQFITALEKAGMTKLQASKATQDGTIADSIVSLMENESPFADEEVQTYFHYNHSFRGFLSVEAQLEAINKICKFQYGVEEILKHVKVLESLSSKYTTRFKYDGYAVVPKIFGRKTKYQDEIRWAIHTAERIINVRHNHMDGVVKEHYEGIRIVHSTQKALQQIEKRFSGHLMVFPVQMGKRYAGCTARRARIKMDRNEFGLPVYVVAWILAVHQGLLQSKGEIITSSCHIGCPGDVYKYIDSKKYDSRLGFRIQSGMLDAFSDIDEVNDRLYKYGPATGFVVG